MTNAHGKTACWLVLEGILLWTIGPFQIVVNLSVVAGDIVVVLERGKGLLEKKFFCIEIMNVKS